MTSVHRFSCTAPIILIR